MRKKLKGALRKLLFLLVLLLCGSGEVTAAEDEMSVYYEWQTEDEILELCDEGLDLSEFFRYTIWGFLSREDLQGLVDNGHTLDDVYAAIESLEDTDWETLKAELPEDVAAVLEAYASVPATLDLGDTRIAGFSGSVSSSLGNIPALGSESHGPILKIHLSGETAFCARFGAACRTGMVYTSVPLTDIGLDSTKERIVRGLLAQYAQAQSIYTGPANYIMTQAGIWLVQNNAWTGDAEGMAASIEPLFSKTPDCPSVEFATAYFQSIVNWMEQPENQSLIAATGLEAWSLGPNQYLVTATGEGASLESLGAYARLEIRKTDSETGNIISENAEFTIYEWNGSAYVKSDVAIERDGDVYRSDDLFRTDTNEGKFYVEESSAPHTGTVTGYYGDFSGGGKNRHEFLVEEGMSGDTIQVTSNGSSFVNQRTTGSIRVYKTDIEADAYISGDDSHGTANLDGAIYELYAGEDIVHPDGVRGVLYRKDTLISTATIRNGSCSFNNLYLGSYYVKERQKGDTLADGKKLSYAGGYLLDETVYTVTLPYEGEATADVHRDVYSNREQVIKAKAVFDKVESAAGQGNINYLAGAGFTIYRIDRLSRVNSFEQNADGTWQKESIQKAYLVQDYNQDTPKYDFSGEEEAVATLYLRDTDLREETALYWEDAQADLQQGKLLSLGSHTYRVAELFSDENGQIVTPYLPYGQYLVVETTVPEDHFMAPPFVLNFYAGRSQVVLTSGVTEQTPYGSNVLKSSGDRKAFCEAVYFSGVIDNEAVEELLRIYKKDADTGKTVLLADTAFKIAALDENTGEKRYLTHTTYYPAAVNQQIFYTDQEGCLQLPELLAAGTYQIEEVQGPNGFYNDVPDGYVRFRVTTDREYQSLLGEGEEGSTLEGAYGNRDVLLIQEDYTNLETRGVLTIRKRGEVLTGIEKGKSGDTQFLYEEQPLAGAEYTIRAAEDIVTQDRQTDEDGNRTLWFRKGEVVAVITTGEQGQVDEVHPDDHPILTVIHEGEEGSVKVLLPLGSYEVEETKAPYGYTGTKEIFRVTFTWEHQFQEYIDQSVTVANARVKAVPEQGDTTPGIGIYKRAKEADVPLEGITFGLYTVDPIYSREGTLLADAGELLSVCRTGEDGKAVFTVDVPIRSEACGEEDGQNSGCYEIIEMETPSGVFLDSTPIQLEFLYQDSDTEFMVLQAEQQNVTSEVAISKRDMAGGEELSGAKLTVTEEWSGRITFSWISENTPKILRGLAVNADIANPDYTYLLTETAAPEGYLKAESIRFCLVWEEMEATEVKVYVYDGENGWMEVPDGTVVMLDEAGEEMETPQVSESRDLAPGTPESHPSVSDTEEIVLPQTGDRGEVKIRILLIISILSVGLIIFIKKHLKNT